MDYRTEGGYVDGEDDEEVKLLYFSSYKTGDALIYASPFFFTLSSR